MQRYWSSTLIGFVIATSFTAAQGFPPASTTPPASVAEPRGAQRPPLPPSAQTRADTTVTMAGCIQEGATAPVVTVPAAGPAAGTNGANPAEKAAERAGNVPDPHEGPAAGGAPTTTVTGGDSAPADTRTGRGATSRERASANLTGAGSDAHKVYFLINATMAADGGRSRDVTGTSGLTSPKGYRLETARRLPHT